MHKILKLCNLAGIEPMIICYKCGDADHFTTPCWRLHMTQFKTIMYAKNYHNIRFQENRHYFLANCK
jgi:hypothetical protein